MDNFRDAHLSTYDGLSEDAQMEVLEAATTSALDCFQTFGALKPGESLAGLFAAGNFDSGVFDDPRRFDLSREPNQHLSFGRGPHSCLGKHVAALEIKILLEELLQRTKDIQPAGEISYSRDNYSRGVYELPVKVTPA